ncbi:MAG: Nramp family divalent metal transporter [Clostridia bacterium]|nr:Nramp family divalent metal transporter [Clostridia bacterium]
MGVGKDALVATSRSLVATAVRPSGLARIAAVRGVLPFFGPAFVASIAYMDPGNFATNIEGGSRFNYDLLWVILWSNLMAIFIQSLSAKLGIATGRTLPELCRDHFPKTVNGFLWVAAEVAAMATDLAEFLGAALGFYLLLRMPLLTAALLTGAVTFALLAFERRGYRALEGVIMVLLAVIAGSYLFELALVHPDWAEAGRHLLIPSLTSESAYVAVGMLGATVMPHVVYLHSDLVRPRLQEGRTDRRTLFRMERLDVLVAMNVAFLVNASLVILAAAAFHRHGVTVVSIEQAHRTLAPLFGDLSSTVFAVGLLASGLSSSVVGTMAGQVIMQGFVRLRIGLFWRRLITMLPAIAVIALGLDPLAVLVLSQVVLSFELPFAVAPLVLFTSRRDVMGELVNRPATIAVAVAVVTVVVTMNGFLLYETFREALAG